MSNTDDDDIKKISKMLEIGGTMLAQHCGNCGAPMFRYQGRVLCPVCEDVRDPRAGVQPSPAATSSAPAERPVSSVKQSDEPVAASPGPARQVSGPSANTVPLQGSYPELETLLVNKMTSIAREMQGETDARRIAEYLDLIERFTDVISKIRGR